MPSPVQFSGRYTITVEIPEDVQAKAQRMGPDARTRIEEDVFHKVVRDITHRDRVDERLARMLDGPEQQQVLVTNDSNGDAVESNGKHFTEWGKALKQLERTLKLREVIGQRSRGNAERNKPQSNLDRAQAREKAEQALFKRFADGATEIKVRVTDCTYIPEIELLQPKFEYLERPRGFKPEFGTVLPETE